MTLDYIFRNSLAKARVRYPKSKDKVIDYLKAHDTQLYNTNTEFWVQRIDNKEYHSWLELKEELNQHYDEILQQYNIANNIES